LVRKWAISSALAECCFCLNGSVSSPCRNRKELNGPQSRADIPQPLYPGFENEGNVPHSGEVFKNIPVDQSVITGVRFGIPGEFPVYSI